MNLNERLKYHVSGAIERGEAEPVRGFYTTHVHSQDPRKKKITDALKAKSGGTKITLVKEVSDENGVRFIGQCLAKGLINWTNLGTFSVRAKDIGL